jgi:hypothetical protein
MVELQIKSANEKITTLFHFRDKIEDLPERVSRLEAIAHNHLENK